LDSGVDEHGEKKVLLVVNSWLWVGLMQKLSKSLLVHRWRLPLIVLLFFSPQSLLAQDEIEIPNSLLKIIRSVNVPVETEGVISELAVAPGDLVAENDVMARVRQDAARLVLEAAEFELQVAKAKVENNIDIRYSRKALEVAEADLKRALDANERVRDTFTAGEIDHRQLVVERTKLEIEQAEQNDLIEKLNLSLKENAVRQQQHFLERHVIRAPIDGMVVAVQKAESEWANVSDTLIRIVRIDRLRVEDFVPVEVAIGGIEGNPVVFRPAITKLKDRSFHGKIVFVSPEANSLDAKVRIWAEIENTGRQLRPGLKGTLTIQRKAAAPESTPGLTTQTSK
jgi:multidrug efflux pump subunit AcrA (membrane-fusion protein)